MRRRVLPISEKENSFSRHGIKTSIEILKLASNSFVFSNYMEIHEDGWVSAKEAAEILGLAYTTICKYINEGRLEAAKENKQWKVKSKIIESAQDRNIENSMDLHRTIELLQNTVSLLEGTIDELRSEIKEKNTQIEQLHTIIAMSQLKEEQNLVQNFPNFYSVRLHLCHRICQSKWCAGSIQDWFPHCLLGLR